MGQLFPSYPTSGAGAKVFMNTNAGTLLNLESMTLQASKMYLGKLYENLIYQLGEGKTMLNMDPEEQPVINIDGILAGMDITPGVADKVSVTAGIIEVDGEQIAVPANTAVDLTIVSAAETVRWNAIIVDEATQAITAVAGTAVAAETGLNDTYGTAAGNKPLIGTDKLLVGFVEVGTTGVVAASKIKYYDREEGGIDYQILPNIGGVRLNNALVKCHTGGIGRQVKFTGRYYDDVMAEIPTAKDFSLTPVTNQTSEQTFNNSYGSTTVSGFNFAYNQLAADSKALNNVYHRRGHCAIREQYPNGFFFQTSGTIAPTFNVNATGMNAISVTGSCADFPARSDEM